MLGGGLLSESSPSPKMFFVVREVMRKGEIIAGIGFCSQRLASTQEEGFARHFAPEKPPYVPHGRLLFHNQIGAARQFAGLYGPESRLHAIIEAECLRKRPC